MGFVFYTEMYAVLHVKIFTYVYNFKIWFYYNKYSHSNENYKAIKMHLWQSQQQKLTCY